MRMPFGSVQDVNADPSRIGFERPTGDEGINA
jgi:hypothetical protein